MILLKTKKRELRLEGKHHFTKGDWMFIVLPVIAVHMDSYKFSKEWHITGLILFFEFALTLEVGKNAYLNNRNI